MKCVFSPLWSCDTFKGISGVPTLQSAAEVSKALHSFNGHQHTLAWLDNQTSLRECVFSFFFLSFVVCQLTCWMTGLPICRGLFLLQVQWKSFTWQKHSTMWGNLLSVVWKATSYKKKKKRCTKCNFRDTTACVHLTVYKLFSPCRIEIYKKMYNLI